jgi:hydrogenase maturation factor
MDESSGVAVVDIEGAARRVSVSPLVLDGRTVQVGDWLLIHAGLAVDVLDERAALDLSELIRSQPEDRT